MEFEYCQKCDKGIRTDEKTFVKNEQILCEQCYLRSTRKRHNNFKLKKQTSRNKVFMSKACIGIIILLLTIWAYQSYREKQVAIKHKETVAKELRKAQIEYDKAVTQLESIRLWAEIKQKQSNTELQDHVDSMFTPDGEILPNWIASPVINTAIEINAQNVRAISEKVKFFEDEVSKAANKLTAAKRKTRDADVKR